MGLEAATYIGDLIAANPTSGDKRKYGDDHLRLIKTVLLNTFPGLTGAVTATQSQINTGIAAALKSLIVGEIRMYYGDPVDLPAGWHVCDGTNGTPNMEDLVPIGAGNTYTLGQSVGATTPTTSSNGGFTPAGTVGGTALTEAQLPSHRHLTVTAGEGSTQIASASASIAEFNNSIGGDTQYILRELTGEPTAGRTSAIGSGATHTHTFTGNAVAAHTHTVSVLQPARAVHFIMYTGV